MKNIALLVCVLIAVVGLVEGAGKIPDKPNVLLILADDLGYHDLGFQGSEHIKTPNLNREAIIKGERLYDSDFTK